MMTCPCFEVVSTCSDYLPNASPVTYILTGRIVYAGFGADNVND